MTENGDANKIVTILKNKNITIDAKTMEIFRGNIKYKTEAIFIIVIDELLQINNWNSSQKIYCIKLKLHEINVNNLCYHNFMYLDKLFDDINSDPDSDLDSESGSDSG